MLGKPACTDWRLLLEHSVPHLTCKNILSNNWISNGAIMGWESKDFWAGPSPQCFKVPPGLWWPETPFLLCVFSGDIKMGSSCLRSHATAYPRVQQVAVSVSANWLVKQRMKPTTKKRVSGQRWKATLAQTWLNTGTSAWFTEAAVK